MGKKKKKSKAGDARGYGQATVFRPEPSPHSVPVAAHTDNKAARTTADVETKLTDAQDDWNTAVEQDEKELQALSSKNASSRKKIPPKADVRLPNLSDETSRSSVVMSTAMHELLDELVAPLPWQSFIGAPEMGIYRYDRLIKKFAYLYDYLLAAGFTWDQIRLAGESLGREKLSIDLGAMLDWLCLSLDAKMLPIRFLDERGALLQRQARQEEQDEDTAEEPSSSTVLEEANEEEVAQKTSSEPSDGGGIHNETKISEDEVQNAGDHDVSLTSVPSTIEKTKDEEWLENLEKEFDEVESEYKDEASKYMLSKHEVKELEKRYKQKKKEVDRVKNKVKKAREKKKAEEPLLNDEREDGPAFGGFFDEDDEFDVAQETTDVEANIPSSTLPRVYVPKDAIPTSWTGKTPKEILEERCRNLKLPRPNFQNLERNGCRVLIRGQAGLDVEERAVFDSKGDGQHYVATKALYRLDPTLPIHRSLPPFYRDLWKGWANEVQNTKDEKQRAEEERRKQDILELLSHVSEQDATPSGKKDYDNSEGMKKDPTDSMSGTALDSLAKNHPDDEKLRVDFESRFGKKSYQSMLEQRTSLPIYGFRTEILDTVARFPVTILHAETGAGKTTQCPQFLLEHALKKGNGGSTSILCTQPRRVAATSVAERVAEEMCTNLGNEVGYSIRLENRRSNQTRLLFCTTGVILRRLIEDPLLTGISHVVVDEVHERQWQIDVLLVALRRLVKGPRRDLKVVLMSATLDAKLFCSFFDGAPLVSVPGRTFPVSNYFLEDIVEATGHIVEDDSPNALRNYQRSEKASLSITTKGGRERKEIVSLDSEVDPMLSGEFSNYSLTTRRTMDRVDESVLNYDLVEDVLHLLLVEKNGDHVLKAPEGRTIERGAILVFLPGIGEIRTLSDRLQASSNFRDRRTFDIIPMHSALSSTEQRRAFLVPRKVRWAIIVATNIAETSVTIPDVVCVIDCGRVREVRHDKRSLTRKLVTTWCSRASTRQRAGRAGRVQPGVCLRMFSSRTHHRSMQPTTEPELQRLPLEEVCLTIMAGGLAPRGCFFFLSQAPQPPKPDAVQSALTSLEQVGAITIPAGNGESAQSPQAAVETLTPLGRQLAKLPVDARLGKMLLLSVQFRCVDTITTIVAGLSASQSPFLSSLRDGQAALAKQAKFQHENSDFLTLLNLYNAYIDAGETFSFCRENYVSFSALREMKEARKHYLDLLRGMGWLEKDSRLRNSNGKYEVVLHAVIAAALSQMARIEREPGKKDSLWHRSISTADQQVHIHRSSVNATLPRRLPTRWIVFFEKFATSSRVSISMTAFCSPLSLVLLVGHDFHIQHALRQIVLDGWMKVGLAATTAIRMRALRNQLRDLHKEEHLVDGVVALLKEDAALAALWEPVAAG